MNIASENSDNILHMLKDSLEHFNNARYSQAEAICNDILRQTDNPFAHHLIASCKTKKGSFEEAITHQKCAVKSDPKNIDFIKNMELIYRQNKQYEEAIEAIKIAIKLDDSRKEFYYCAGISYGHLWQIDEAKEVLQHALKLDPDYVNAHIMLGNILQELCDYDLAATHFNRAHQLDPNDSFVAYNRSLLLLMQGDFERGFLDYEKRWEQGKQFALPKYFANKPMWDGASFHDKTLFVMMEQGHGDSIQFCRYLPEILKHGSRLIIRCPENLISLLKPLAPEANWINPNDPTPEFDEYITMMSLPLVMNTTLGNTPNKVPYIKSTPERIAKWKDKITSEKRKIGCCWSGSVNHPKDKIRSINPEDFAKIFDNKDCVFYLLQKGRDEDIAQEFSDRFDNVINLGCDIKNFADTAAILEQMDEIISVDTALVHLAGALAKPVSTLLLFNADWRWFIDREDSPWYPTMQLVRQNTRDSWDSVLQRVAEKLTKE